MNPDTNRFEPLTDAAGEKKPDPHEHPDKDPLALLRPDGSPVPSHWPVFAVGEMVVIKDYTFRVAYIGETAILFEPVGLPIVGETTDNG